MNTENLCPAILDYKNNSEDFLDCIADMGETIATSGEGGTSKTAIFVEGNLVLATYSHKDNWMRVEFLEHPEDTKAIFMKYLDEDIFNDESELMYIKEETENKINFRFYFKDEI